MANIFCQQSTTKAHTLGSFSRTSGDPIPRTRNGGGIGLPSIPIRLGVPVRPVEAMVIPEIIQDMKMKRKGSH